MNPSSRVFDSSLKEISHYQAFPAMLPFVGQDYVSANHPKLLILGESFYFPEESTLHKDPSRWYSTNQNSLTATEYGNHEADWINCRGLLECDWSSPGHKMYRELNGCLKELDLSSRDRPMSHICYTNTFMRPAICGESFRHYCADQDMVISTDVLTKTIAVLAPDIVIFSSKYAWDAIGRRLAKQIAEPTFDFTSHPAGHFYWHRESYPHGRKKFMSLLRKWATKLE